MPYLFTSESVSEGHPDKVCDQISDGVLDAIFAKDPNARVACETFVTTGLVVVGGEITTKAYVDVERLSARQLEKSAIQKQNINSIPNRAVLLTQSIPSPPILLWELIPAVQETRVLCSGMPATRLPN